MSHAADTPDERAAVRSVVFGHLAGIVVAPTLKALADRRVFDSFHPTAATKLSEIAGRTGANRGYLRVAVRLLASCGWLEQCLDDCSDPAYSLTQEGAAAVKLLPLLGNEAISFIPKSMFLEDALFGRSDELVLPTLEALVRGAKESWGIASQEDPVAAKVCAQMRAYLDGLVLGPVMVALARGGVLEQLLQHGSMDLASISANPGSLSCAFDLLAMQGWVARDRDAVRLTSCGRYAAQIATSYGVTVSYLPTFQVVSTLLFGNPRIPRMDENGVELLVNRGMNIWGSGGAHTTYFKKVDEIIAEIFNRPLERQPHGICDMGCGDGTLLEHLYSVVRNRTARGSVLAQHPLVMVGVDFNKVARRVAKQNLRRAEILTFHVISGDINRPAQLAGDLEALGLDVHDLLHVRSFLDHNRPYSPPANYFAGSRKARTTGAFAHLGREIAPDELEENLVRHLRRWAPYVGRFGLLALELHTLPPDVTAMNLEKTPAVAYDGTHGFSDQYLVELPIFLDCAREAGLQADARYQAKFPPSELATVSLNYFTAPGFAQP